MKSDSTSDKDEISINVVKHNKETTSNMLDHVVCVTLLKGCIPNSFNCVILSSIHERSDKTAINKYRPISVSNIFSTIFERSVKT